MAIVLMEILRCISKPPQKIASFIRVGVNMAFGVGLCLLTTIHLNDKYAENYLYSAWLLPTLCLTLFAAVVVVHIGIPSGLRRHKIRSVEG